MDFQCYLPGRMVFGSGKINLLPDFAKKIGGKPLIVTSLKGVKILDNVLKIVENTDMKYSLFLEVQPNPTTDLIEKVGEKFKKENCDYAIGIGGGSSIDFAKAIAIRASHPEEIWNYVYLPYRETLQITEKTYPVIAVTTTSGTGSEVTKWAVVTNPISYEKSFLESEYIIPRVAIVDPELTLGLPKLLTAATGMDALSHAIESYININSTPFSDITAEASIKIISRYLSEAVADGSNLIAREKMAWANTLAGITIEHAGTNLVHAMGHVLGGRLNIDHGIAMALCLEPVLKYSWTSNIEKFAKLTEFLGKDISRLTQEKAAKMSSVVIKELMQEIGINMKLSDLGVKEDMIETFVEDAFKYLSPMIDASPKRPSKDKVKELYFSIL